MDHAIHIEYVKHETQFFAVFDEGRRGNHQSKLGKYISHDKRMDKTEV